MKFKSVLDRSFKYRNACSTDIRLTFERVRREQRLATQRCESAAGYDTKVLAAFGARQGN